MIAIMPAKADILLLRLAGNLVDEDVLGVVGVVAGVLITVCNGVVTTLRAVTGIFVCV